MIINKDELCTVYTDLTGQFPFKSIRGNTYVLVEYHYDANCIIAEPSNNRTARSITQVWTKSHQLFKQAEIAPSTYIMDNETSGEFIRALKEKGTAYHLIPSHTHRRNLAERAIQSWKKHFKAGLASIDPYFPLSEWDSLIHQTNISLNPLRSSRINPKMSATSNPIRNSNIWTLTVPIFPPPSKQSHKES